MLLQGRSELQIVREVGDGIAAVKAAQLLKPDLILLDIGLPLLNGLEAAQQMRQLCPSSKIVFLSQDNSLDIMEKALEIGALGYVYKLYAMRELLYAIGAALRNEQFLSSAVKGYELPESCPLRGPSKTQF